MSFRDRGAVTRTVLDPALCGTAPFGEPLSTFNAGRLGDRVIYCLGTVGIEPTAPTASR